MIYGNKIYGTYLIRPYLLEKTGNTKIKEKITALLQSIQKDPFKGLGKSEPLKFKYSGCWSRRINKEHRLVYYIESDICYIIAMRFHY